MRRRQVLQNLLYASGGVVGALLLPSCQFERLSVLFSPESLKSGKLPAHLITPLSEFYVQSYATPPKVKVEEWQLRIMGAVERERAIAFSDILAAPQEDFYLTMECIGNPAGGSLIGNAQWTGTPLLPFLKQAGIQPEAVEVRLHGADSYETTLPVATFQRSDIRLVHRMNGQPLTQEHGYPVRIIIPGHFGQKQPKWLVKIELISSQKQGLWERQGWSNTAEIPIHSLTRQVQEIAVGSHHNQVSLERGKTGWDSGMAIAGVALDKSLPIKTIWVSTDGGQQWHKAEQNSPESPHEWTIWRYQWQPQQPGVYNVLVRAQSETEIQPLRDGDRKDGSNGILPIQVTLQG